MGVGGWVESIIRLISAEAEAEALLGLDELGKNATLNSEQHALYEKFKRIQSEVNRRDDSFFCFLMNQTMIKNARGAITIHNLGAIIFL